MDRGLRRTGRARMVAAAATAVSVGVALLAPPAYAADSVASVTDVTVTEGDSGTTGAVFTVTLSESNGTTTVTYTTTDSSAGAGSDYTATSGTLTFGPGETSKTVTVPVLGDTLDEPNEAFFFGLTTIDNGTFEGGDATGVGTILDDDAPPSISIGDASVTEGSGGTTTTTVTVSLSAPSGRFVAVDFATADGTATFDDADYHSRSGRLVFDPGQTAQTITLTVVSDTEDEADETFFVDLSSPQAATIAAARSTITILDDDPATQPPPSGSLPTLSIGDASVAEGNSGTVQTTVTVTLSSASEDFVGVDFATQDGTATFAGGDYHSQSGRLVFAPGETSKTITLTVSGDVVDEADESFFVDLAEATNATIGDARSVITILDDDTGTTPPPSGGTPPAVSIADVQVTEGNIDETRVAVTVSLSAAATGYVTVDFQATDGSALFSDADYWRTSGRLVFAPGDTTETVTATIVGDTRAEPNEVFYIDLSDVTGATMADPRGAITILDDDGGSGGGGLPAITVADTSVQEGDAGTSAATVAITLSKASTDFVTVDVATADGTASFADGDYWETGGRIVFAPGETSQALELVVNGDTVAEGNEVFYLGLTGSSTNATIADARAAITILDDDGPAPSRTGLRVVKWSRRLVARGMVVPPHPGAAMRVVLRKKRDGRFRTIAVRRPTLRAALDRDGDGVAESTYRARFPRPKRGRCLVRAVFRGDADHLRSVAVRRFWCGRR